MQPSSLTHSELRALPEDWVFGLGEWGTVYGPVFPGESLVVPGVPPGQDYIVKWDGQIALGAFEVAVSAYTDIALD